MDTQEVEKLAALARIALNQEEKEAMAKDLQTILGYVSQIKEVSGGEETKLGAHRNVFREDGVPHDSGLYTEELLKQSADRRGNYIAVKKVLKEGR